MKKVFLAFAVVAALAACNDGNGSESAAKTDSPAVKVDTPVSAPKVDSPAMAPKVDSPAMAPKVDSPAVKK